MKYKLLIFLMFVFILSNTICFSINITDGKKVTFDDKQIKICTIIGKTHLNAYNESVYKKGFRYIIKEWNNKDGAYAYILSDAFLSIMLSNPSFFFKEMIAEKTIFLEWLDLLESLSFTWHNSLPNPLIKYKKQIIENLKIVEIEDKTSSILKNQFVKVLKKIKVSTID